MMKNKYKVLIISCWALLILCLIFKLFGANIFEPYVKSERFIKLCDFIDNNFYLKIIVACIVSLILNTFTVLAILGQKFYTKLQAIIFIPLITLTSIISWYSNIVNIVLNVLFFILPTIWLKKKWYRSLLGFGLITSFQLISMFIRNISNITLNYETTLIAIILQVDSFIMVVLYYLYSNYLKLKRKEMS